MKSVSKLRALHLISACLISIQLCHSASAASLDDLFNAAKLGDAAEVAQLVRQGMDVNSSDPSGNTLLILATREEQPKVVSELLKQRGIKLNARNSAGDSALMLASLRGFSGIAQQLLEAGATFDHPGWNPLLYAAFEGHTQIAGLLLEKGANPNVLAPNQTTPLMFAARNGHEDVVRLLLKSGANIDWRNDQNESAESWASKNRNTDIVELIQAERKARASKLHVEIN